MRRKPGVHYGWYGTGIALFMFAIALLIGYGGAKPGSLKADALMFTGAAVMLLGAMAVTHALPKQTL